MACNDAARASVDDDEIDHFASREDFEVISVCAAQQCAVSAEQELLSRLSASIERSRDLDAAEGTIIEISCVVAGEGNALCDAQIDDGAGDFGEAIDIGFAGAEVAALEGIFE